MKLWLVAVFVFLGAIAIGAVLRYRRQRHVTASLSDRWIAEHVDDPTRPKWWK